MKNKNVKVQELKKLKYNELEKNEILDAVEKIDTAFRIKNKLKKVNKYLWGEQPQGVYAKLEDSNLILIWTFGEFMNQKCHD